MIDLTAPEVPRDIFDVALEDADLTYSLRCDELWDEIVTELRDSDYTKRSHHNVSTYDQGCRGPLCRKAHREHPRRRSPESSTLALREERIYDPVLEYFHVVAKYRIRLAQQAILREIQENTA